VQQLAPVADEVFATCRDPEAAEKLIAFARRASNVHVLPLDVADAVSLTQASAAVQDPVDLLVCNAGVNSGYSGLSGPENALTPDAMDGFAGLLRTNVAGPFFTVQAFISHLMDSDAGRVAIISSQMGSQQHDAGNAYAYRASKAAANNLMVSLSNELAAKSIAVAAYHPGWVRTEMGGPRAHLSVEESAEALTQRFHELDMSQTGRFLNYDGTLMVL
jgi:NAD(P)-dependent dehydrogenase (short-subunit alcohol dehydrogenase family)